MPRIWFEQNQTTFARAWILDERDHAILCSLLEHKVLTTDQIKSLYFCSLRRCQHRLKELRELGFVASFTPRRGFGEGRPPDCLFLTKLGLSACAESKGVRASDLSWIPDEGYRSSQNLAHRLGVNAFFCALVEASRAHEDHCLFTWRPEHWVRTKAAEIKPDGFGRYLHPGGACEFYLEYDRGTEAFGALSRKLEGYLRLAAGWTEEQDLLGFPNLLIIVAEGCARGRSARPFATRSRTSTFAARWRRRSLCTWRARISCASSGCSGRRGGTWLRTVSASRSSTCLPGRATST